MSAACQLVSIYCVISLICNQEYWTIDSKTAYTLLALAFHLVMHLFSLKTAAIVVAGWCCFAHVTTLPRK